MSSRPQVFSCLLAVLLLSGCTGEVQPTPSLSSTAAVNAPTLPAQPFPALPDRGNGVTTSVDALVSDGSTLVMQATIDGRTSVPVLRASSDGGDTWTDGQLSEAAAKATELGESTEHVVAVAPTGAARSWLALGRKNDALIAWTSADAALWNRTLVTGIDPRRDTVHDVVGLSGGGFVAVGAEWTDPHSYPRVWTSSDGVSWSKHKLPGRGSLFGVAAKGNRLVAVGHNSLTEVTAKGRSGYSLLFSSTARGASWRRTTVREPSDSGNFTSWLDQVVATESGFIVGGSYYDEDERTYRPFLQQSSNLRTWKAMPKPPELDESSGLLELLQLGRTTLIVQDASSASGSDRVWVQLHEPGDTGWRLAGTPALSNSVTHALGVVAGDHALLSVTIESRPTRTELWTVNRARDVTRVELAEPTAAPAAVQPHGLILVDGEPVAYGDAQGVDVLWRSDGAAWTAPRVVREKAGESVDRMDWSRSGGFLATGQQQSDHAFVLHSNDGVTWRQTPPRVFNPVAQYHASSINSTAWAHGRWVVVGDKTTNGSARAGALAYASTNGERWAQGRATKVTARGDWYGRSRSAGRSARARQSQPVDERRARVTPRLGRRGRDHRS